MEMDVIDVTDKEKNPKPKRSPDSESLLKEKQMEIDRLELELKDMVGTLQRVQAEFENYKKRVLAEQQKMFSCASRELVKELLPLLDLFELAIKNKDNTKEFIKGTEMIYANLVSTLEKEGLVLMDACGSKFDPYLHEALMQEESDVEPGTVLEEFQKGYKMKDAVLRHAKVKIAKKRVC